MERKGPLLARLRRHLEQRRRAWLWPLMLIALLVIVTLLFGDRPPMAAIISVLM